MINWLKTNIFNIYGQFSGKEMIILGIFFLLLIIFAIIIFFVFKNKKIEIESHKELRDKLFNTSLTIGIVGIVYIFMVWQGIPYLSSPIILITIIIAFLYYLVYTIMFWQKKIKIDKEKYYQEMQYSKYLPKKKQFK